MQRTKTIETSNLVGQEVLVKGWIHGRRNMGKIAFFDLRDRWGILQVVAVPSELDAESAELMKGIRTEYVVAITGVVQARGEKQINKDMPTGGVELLAKKIAVYAEANTTPFEIDNEERQANEELRLKYRYLDLRHERLQKNIILRHNVINFLRNELYKQDFLEIETPYISKSTPEGARDFLVPSRNYPGKFYALPQSPQQYKQMLMVAGFDKYCQIVRCFRDEDQRGDRQAEFTQLDIERSFVEQEDILAMVEKLVIDLVKNITPDKKISSTPFPRVTFQEAMSKHNSDKPDLRQDKNDPNELAFAWIVDFPMFEYKEGDKRWGAVHHPFTAFDSTKMSDLEKGNLGDIKAYQYDLVLNGYEVAGGSIRTHDPEVLKKVFKALGHSDKEIQSQFGHLMEAFKYGVPPHGGIAFGLDRLLMILAGESSIKEVIPFPKTTDNRDPLMDSPSDVSKEQLDELKLKKA